MDELHELRGTPEVAERAVAVLRRIAAQGEEARDPGVEELAHETVRLRVGRPHACEVRHRLHRRVLEDVAEHGERPVSGGAARAERHRDEGGGELGEPVDRASESDRRRVAARWEQLEGDGEAEGHRCARGAVRGDRHGAPSEWEITREGRIAATVLPPRHHTTPRERDVGRVPGSAVAPGSCRIR